MFVVTASPARTALKISQLTDGGMPPTCDSMHQFPIFAGARVYPDLIGRRGFGRSLCLSDYWSGRARTNVFLVRFDPVGGYLALGGLEIQLAGAYELVELASRSPLFCGPSFTAA
jgi:hypothetical protein